MRFLCKDMCQIKGFKTSCGNPDFYKYSTKAIENAPFLQKILDEGAILEGITICDEFFYSIIGENSQITKLIDKQFSFSNIEKVSDSNADLVIEFIVNNYQKRILSLAWNGQIVEFELIQTIEYRVNLNGQWTEPRRLEAIREYTYDPTLYNAARAEEGYLKDSMIDQLSRSIIIEISNLRE